LQAARSEPDRKRVFSRKAGGTGASGFADRGLGEAAQRVEVARPTPQCSRVPGREAATGQATGSRPQGREPRAAWTAATGRDQGGTRVARSQGRASAPSRGHEAARSMAPCRGHAERGFRNCVQV